MAIAESESAHPWKNYHPTVWGDFFITQVVPAADEVVNDWNEEIKILKSNIKKKLSDPISNVLERLSLIDAAERLGVGYHFEKEIEQDLEQVYGDKSIWSCDDDNDLNTVALRFRLLRQHGYKASCDVFNKFRSEGEEEGFKKELTDDIEGMLNLYEAAYLRTREESILGEAVEFTTAHLRSKVADLETHVAERVTRALERPLLKVAPIVEHLFFVSSAYEHLSGHDPVLLRLAKLNFNVLQHMYQAELRPITEWWIKLDSPTKLPYARDKLVETYFWGLGLYWEPKHYLARYFATKITLIGTLVDDTFDIHAGLRLILLLLQVDTSAKGLKDYMIVLFDALADVHEEIEAVTSKEGRPWVLDYMKRGISNVARLYLEEERRSQSYKVYATICGLGDSVSKSDFEWLASSPEMLIISSDICRFQDDLADNMKEPDTAHFASSLECYMKQYGASRQEAIDGLNKLIDEDWMIMNEELLLNIPSHVCKRVPIVILNLVRFMDTNYKDYDGYTHSSTRTKDILVALLLTPMVV
ncbi:unnamed protein product [Linum tenue]|uniref:Uncharacterized protein n=1 Tax=Linum tenue TaxID=586396 RepID=A0AAV0IMZ6_9ROSI|nr:unnamed protein product [Linum tenue]